MSVLELVGVGGDGGGEGWGREWKKGLVVHFMVAVVGGSVDSELVEFRGPVSPRCAHRDVYRIPDDNNEEDGEAEDEKCLRIRPSQH